MVNAEEKFSSVSAQTPFSWAVHMGCDPHACGSKPFCCHQHPARSRLAAFSGS